MNRYKVATFIIVALIGGFLVYYSTTLSASISSDSVEYMMGAKNLINGNGFTILNPNGSFVPITLHPPLYSLFLAFLNLLGFTSISAARWLSILLMVATVSILGLGIYRLSSSYSLAITTSLVFTLSASVQEVYYIAMSDGLSLFLTILALLVLVHLVQRPTKSILVLFSFLSAMIVLTRFIGIVILPTGVLILLISHSDTWSKRLKFILSYLSLFILITLPYLFYSINTKSAVAGRKIVIDSHLWSNLAPFRVGLINTIWSWIPFNSSLPAIPYPLQLFFLVSMSVILGCLLVLVIVRKTRRDETIGREDTAIPTVFLTYGFIFLVGFAASYLFTFPKPDVNPRTLIPALLVMIVVFFSMIWLLAKELGKSKQLLSQLIMVLSCILILAGSTPFMWSSINGWHNYSGSCGSPIWINSSVIPAILKLPASTPLIASDEACIYLLTGRRPYDLRDLQISNLLHIPRFGDNPSDPLQVIFREQKAALIITSGFEYYLEAKYSYGVGDTTIMQSLVAGLVSNNYHNVSIYYYP
jgi:hypothetical protein